MLRTLFILTSIAGGLLLFQSCSKIEGPGGSSSIIGKIHIQVKDLAGNIINEYDAPNEDVFLIYGDDDTFYDDDVKTSFDGSFEFNYLQKGTYTLFVYEDCVTCPSGKNAVQVEIEILDNKSTIDVGTINIQD